jgi:signal transduction histidine kinase
MEKILVVDDERSIRTACRRMLENEGFCVFEAWSADEALQLMKSSSFDLAMVDIMLPEMDGITFAGELKRIDENIEVIIMTGFPSMETALGAFNARASDFIIKPFSNKQLIRAAVRCLERKRLLQAIEMMNRELETKARDLEKRNRELEEASAFKSQLISIIAHDLRSPLTAMAGYSELMCLTDLSPLEVKEMAREMQDGCLQLESLVHNLLDLSRIESGIIRCERKPVDMDGMLKRSVRIFQTRAGSHSFHMNISSEPVLGDEEKIFQILNNLIGNAVKFSPPGSSIEISTTVKSEVLELRIRDEGIGIPAEEIPRIFQRFYRVSGPGAPQAPGSGLGLYIVKTLVEAQGGDIHVESEEGKGTTFIIQFPLQSKSESECHPMMQVV